MITGLILSLDKASYCIYEPEYSTVTAMVGVTGGISGDQVTLTLSRKRANGEETLATQTVNLTGANQVHQVSFNLTTYLDSSNEVSLVRSSDLIDDFAIEAANANRSVTSKQAFSVLLVSVDGMVRDYAGGLSLQSGETMEISHPLHITGVFTRSVSAGTASGPKTLAWSNSGKTLAFGGGTPVAISLVKFGEYILRSTKVDQFIKVMVNPTLLPGSDQTETLQVSEAEVPESAIIRELIAVKRYLETQLAAYVEPAHVITQLLANDYPNVIYDFLLPPAHYYRPRVGTQYYSVRLPSRPIKKLLKLEGHFGESHKVVTVGADWRQVQPSGVVTLIPTGAAILNWTVSTVGVSALLAHRSYIPNFWQAECFSGLGDCPADLRAWVAKRTMMRILAQAGTSRYGGVSSYSLSRDGVSESRSFNPAGPYAALIDRYAQDTGLSKDGKETMIGQFKTRYVGYSMVVL